MGPYAGAMSSQESSHRDAPAQAAPSPSDPEQAERADERAERSERAMRAVAQRCEELQAQVASLSAAAAIRVSIIDEQVARIGDLERHLTAVDALVADLQRRLGQDPAVQAPPPPVSLRRRAYWRLRRQAGSVVRRIVR